MADPAENLPAQFGPYRRLRSLGAGAMGAVLEVEHVETRGRYALKLIQPEVLLEIGAARFRREAEIMARLTHPNLARIHAAHLTPPCPYLVLDLYPGGSLTELLEAGPLAVERASEIAAQLAEGLAHAHANQVVHRDLKPDNVLFDDRGQAVIADFGVSRQGAVDRMTRTGELLGTPLYMAPEQTHGAKHAGPAADVYALGALLYRMLTGRPPIEPADTVLGTLARVHEQPPRPLRELCPTAPRALEALCARTLAKDPALRPSAAELAEALRSPTSAAVSSVPRRRLLALASAAVGVLAVAAGLAVWRTASHDAPPPMEPAAPSPVEPSSPRLLPPWIVALDGERVTLTVGDNERALSLLVASSLRPGAERSTEWVLDPLLLRTWDGGAATRRQPPEAGDEACAQLLGAPLVLRFDAAGRYEACASPLAESPEPPTTTLDHLAWTHLRAAGLNSLAQRVLALKPRYAESARDDELILDDAGALRAVVLEDGPSWVAVQRTPPPAGEDEELLRTVNGLELPAALEGPLVGPTNRAHVRVRPRAPFRLLAGEPGTRVHAFPWGPVLGKLAPQLAYVRLPSAVRGWQAVGWRGGEGWVRDEFVSPSTQQPWVAVVCSGPDRPLEVFHPSLGHPLGVLHHGQVVAVYQVDQPGTSPGVPGARFAELGSNANVIWGAGLGRVKTSEFVSPLTGYQALLLLYPLETEVTLHPIPVTPRLR